MCKNPVRLGLVCSCGVAALPRTVLSAFKLLASLVKMTKDSISFYFNSNVFIKHFSSLVRLVYFGSLGVSSGLPVTLEYDVG